MLDGLKGLQGIRSSILTAKNSAFVSALADMFSDRAGAVYYTVSPSNCFTDTGGTTSAAVGDTVSFMSDNFGNMDSVWTTPGTEPTLRQDGDGLYYLELSDGAHAASQTNALDFTDTDFGAVMVALRDDAQSELSALVSTQGTSPSRYAGRMNTGSGSASAILSTDSEGSIHVNTGADLEADGTTRAELVAEFEGQIGVLSGRGIGAATVENNWAFYTHLTGAAPTGRFYMGIVVPGMTEVERAAAVAVASALYGIEPPALAAPSTLLDGDFEPAPSYGGIVAVDLLNEATGDVTDYELLLTPASTGVAGSWQSTGVSGAGRHELTGVATDEIYEVEMRAVNVSAEADPSPKRLVDAVPVDERAFRGGDFITDYSTAGDIYVTKDGDDGNSGTEAAPFLTAAAAFAAVTANQRIKFGEGQYYIEEELVTVDGVIIEPIGTDIVRFNGVTIPTGAAIATGADSTFLGSVPVGEVIKFDVDIADIAYNVIDNLYVVEDGQIAAPSSDRDDDNELLLTFMDEDRFHVADSAGASFTIDTDGSVTGSAGNIYEIIDPDVINATRYPDASMLQDRQVLIRQHPTVIAADIFVKTVDIPGNRIVLHRSTGSGTFSDDTQCAYQGYPGAQNPAQFQYSINGAAVGLEKGRFAYTDNGDGTATVYYRARDVANIDRIGFISSTFAIQADRVDDMEVHGIYLENFAPRNQRNGAIIFGNTYGASAGGVVDNCKFRNLASRLTDVCPVSVLLNTDWTFSNSHVWNCTSNMIRSGWNEACPGRLLHIWGDRLGSTAIRCSFFEGEVSHCYAHRAGYKAHSGAALFYGVAKNLNANVGQRILFMNNELTKETVGYVAFQRAGDIAIIGNFAEVNDYDARRLIVDNSGDGYTAPADSTWLYALQNSCPDPNDASGNDSGGTLDVLQHGVDDFYDYGLPNNPFTCYIQNNVVHGLSAMRRGDATPIWMEAAVPIGMFSGNLPTARNISGFGIGPDYFGPATTNALQSAVYEDHVNSDYTPATGSPLYTVPVQDVERHIDFLRGVFPDADADGHFDQDFKNQTITDWGTPWAGADSSVTHTGTGPKIKTGAVTVTGKNVDIPVTSDTTGSAELVVYQSVYDGGYPTEADVRAGTGGLYTATASVTADTEHTFSLTALAPGAYRAFVTIGSDGSVAEVEGFEILPADITITSVTSTGATSVDVLLTIPDTSAGPVYVAAYADADDPVYPQAIIREMTGALSWTELATPSGTETVAITGLTTDEDYKIHVVQTADMFPTQAGDPVGGAISNIISSATFTATAGAGDPVVVSDGDDFEINATTFLTPGGSSPNDAITHSYTPTSDDNILVVCVAYIGSNAGAPTAEISWRGGSVLTPDYSYQGTGTGYFDGIHVYIIDSPGSTAGDLEVTASGTDSVTRCLVTIDEVSGADPVPAQSGNFSEFGFNDPMTTPFGTTLTGTTSGNLIMYWFGFDSNISALTAAGDIDATEFSSELSGGATGFDGCLMGRGYHTSTGGDQDIEITFTDAAGGSGGAMVVLEFEPE